MSAIPLLPWFPAFNPYSAGVNPAYLITAASSLRLGHHLLSRRCSGHLHRFLLHCFRYQLHFRGLRAFNIDALIDNLKVFNKSGKSRMKQLKLEDQYIKVSEEQFNELRLLVGGDEQQSKPGKKYFFHKWLLARPHCDDDDDRSIGLELCPRCMTFKLVYDCPSNDSNCLFKPCRGCYTCIKRCIECGRDLDIRIGITEYICEDCSVSPKTSS